MNSRIAAAAIVLVCLSFGAQAGELRIPLTVSELNGMDRPYGIVSNGVPLLPGQAQNVDGLRVLDASGKEIPAQFRPLTRWWNKDNSLRWVQVDFITSIGDFANKEFVLTDGRAMPYPSPLKVEQTDESIVVTTGPAQFTINRKWFNLFDRVRIDRNGDGQYALDEECVSPSDNSGSIVVDTYGQMYRSADGTGEVEVEEAGPVRVCIVAKGTHLAPEGKGYSKGMYGFDIRMHFYAGMNLVRLDTVIHNCMPKPIGSPTFDDYSLRLKLNLKAEPLPFNKDEPPVVWSKVYGQAPIDEPLETGESMVLYQDSNGADTWRINSGLSRGDQLDASSFRGYQVRTVRDGKATVLAQGDHARGLVGVGGERFGIVIVPRYFWQQFPKAIEVGHDGSVRIGILPAEYKANHWLQDAAGAGQEMWLHFYARGLTGGAKEQYARDTKTKSDRYRGLMRDRTKPHVIADTLIPPLVALCTPEHYAACGALADLGPYLPIHGAKPFALNVTEARYFTTDYLKGNAYGWQVFGSRWEENAGHTPYNFEPILSTDYLFQYIVSRDPSWLEFGLRRDMHTRNCRGFKIDGTRPFDCKSWKEFQSSNVSEGAWAKRPDVTGPEIARYSRGRNDQRVGWFLCDPAHVSVDEMYDLWCLFGDSRALEASRNAGAVGGAYVAFRPGRVDRLNGWSMRALMRFYDLTGSKECLPYVDKALGQFWQVAVKNRKAPKIPTDRPGTSYEGWYVNIFGRATILAYNVTGDERMRDLAIGLAKGRDKEILRYPSINAFAYDQTGNKANLFDRPEMFARYWVPDTQQEYCHNYFPACDGRLWAKPRPDTTAPAAVGDLAAQGMGGGQVKLTWTAPGDDGKTGKATVYQVKWADCNIVETASRGGNEANFWAAENVSDEPLPSPVGSKEQMVLKGLGPGTYYFALKARDELNNESPISNVCTVRVD